VASTITILWALSDKAGVSDRQMRGKHAVWRAARMNGGNESGISGATYTRSYFRKLSFLLPISRRLLLLLSDHGWAYPVGSNQAPSEFFFSLGLLRCCGALCLRPIQSGGAFWPSLYFFAGAFQPSLEVCHQPDPSFLNAAAGVVATVYFENIPLQNQANVHSAGRCGHLCCQSARI
jgi:hypothetical protein